MKFSHIFRLILFVGLVVVALCMVFDAWGQPINAPPEGQPLEMPKTPEAYVMEKSFNISPTTVYGVLVLLLVLYAGYITKQNHKIQKESLDFMALMNKAVQQNTKDFLESMSLLNNVVQQNTAAIQQFNTLIQVNDEKVLNGMRNILEEHRKETQLLISNLSKDFMSIVLQKLQIPPSGAKDL